MADAHLDEHEWIPWNRPGEIALWFFALVLATLFIHNFVRLGSKHLLNYPQR